MTSLAQRRLAGFRFLAQPPALPEKLPRMDIAVFVGFASAGPLDYPVVIEDPAQFQDIFGDDVPLAWDASRSEAVHACLAPAVRAFFRNGGRRCWVIRVASDEAETNDFPIPGLAQVGGGGVSPAFLRGRSPGSWFDSFDCATALSVRNVEMASAPAADWKTLNACLFTPDDLSAGDLLRLRWLETALEGVQLYFEVSQVELLPESPPSSRRRLFAVKGGPVAWIQALSTDEMLAGPCEVVWRRSAGREGRAAQDLRVAGVLGDEQSPPEASAGHQLTLTTPIDFAPPAGTLLQVQFEGENLWFVVDEVRLHDEDGNSPPSGYVKLLGRGFRRLSSPPPATQSLKPVAEQISFELRARRGNRSEFRLTDLGFTQAHARYVGALPSDAVLFESADLSESVREAEAEAYEDLWREAREPRFPLAGDGLLSAAFIPLGMGALAEPFMLPQHTTAEALKRDGLNEFQAGLFLDSALLVVGTTALMGEADFLRYQSPLPRRLRGIHAALDIEEATLIAVPDAIQRGWRLVDPKAGVDPQFDPALPHPCWGLDDRDNTGSPPDQLQPRWDKFLRCGLRVLKEPRLILSDKPDTLGSFTLTWESVDTDVSFILEEAVETDFSDAAVVYQGTERRRRIFGRSLGQYYYRARAVAGSETSNWSNGVTVWVQPASLWQLAEEQDFSPNVLLNVHRALLRLCAARGDLLAVLALPEHFREDDALAYLDVLRRNASDEEVVVEDQLTLPLGTGEEAAFSFGSVYHPWAFGREPGSGLRRSPPDGAAVGVLARRSLERGAWIAPANELWRGVAGLWPVLNPDRRLELLLAQINQVRQEPTGFMTLNADTLSADPDLRPINVRRLLILLRRMALRLGMTYVFEPNGPALRRRVQRGFESLMDQLFVRGAFAGATRAQSFQVVTDDSLNTPPSMEQGLFRVDLKVAPSLPMSFVTVRLVQLGERGVTSEIV